MDYKNLFITKAKQVHGDKYDYSKVDYVNSSTKVCIICPEHGEFWQRPNDHTSKKAGCPECKRDKVTISQRFTKDDFIEKARKIHGDYYDYSKVNYINSSTKVTIICPIHGEFEQVPNSHLLGHGCKYCHYNSQYLTTEKFIEQAKKLHGDKYVYDKVNYLNSKTPVIITCPIHGDFEQTPNVHLSSHGCPKCNDKFKAVRGSKGEQKISEILSNNKIPYEKQVSILIDTIARDSNVVRVDFMITMNDKIFIIEYNGLQHYKYVPWFHRGGIVDFEKQQRCDILLRNYCTANNINLLEIPYSVKEDNMESLILEFINNK